jgi:hypothetical protein
MSQLSVRAIPDCTRAKAGPTLTEVQAAAVEQIDAAIKALQDMRDRVLDADPDAPGVAWQARRHGQIAVGCASRALSDARELAYLTRPSDELDG